MCMVTKNAFLKIQSTANMYNGWEPGGNDIVTVDPLI